MTDPNYTALLLIVDRSGSMQEIREPMLEGLGQMLRDQAAEPGFLTVDVLMFDDQLEFVNRFSDPANVTLRLEPRGGTALHDAIAYGVTDVANRIDALPEHARPSHVQVVVVTDGFENASREFSPDRVQGVVAERQSLGWSFLFMGANQDAALAGAELGIGAQDSLTFRTHRGSVAAMSRAMSRRVADTRAGRQSRFTEQEMDESGHDEGSASSK